MRKVFYCALQQLSYFIKLWGKNSALQQESQCNFKLWGGQVGRIKCSSGHYPQTEEEI